MPVNHHRCRSKNKQFRECPNYAGGLIDNFMRLWTCNFVFIYALTSHTLKVAKCVNNQKVEYCVQYNLHAIFCPRLATYRMKISESVIRTKTHRYKLLCRCETRRRRSRRIKPRTARAGPWAVPSPSGAPRRRTTPSPMWTLKWRPCAAISTPRTDVSWPLRVKFPPPPCW